MEYTLLNLNTLIPEVPQIVNNNSRAFERALGIVYDASAGVVVVPVNTTGRVRAATGEFVTMITDTLVVRQQFTNLMSNTTSADADWLTAYDGDPVVTRDASTTAGEDSRFAYVDARRSYYKIGNDASIAFNATLESQIVSLLFEEVSVGPPFNIRLDGSTMVTVDAADILTTWLELICVDIDASLINTWVVKRGGGTYTFNPL